ncbi:hypothetical protein GGS23DRAFT_594419 [Durotheca rogersii]|uniref:uncharacterized protein n=1 Tax=Durotheca rogersii TaxID=419775 RepID=UPI00221E9120|nr:uncharacterized protein GGS23DRAFT_594419 [Durotheca rogersii]KAI5866287.1 hypothetical protein GGS23DRAFT_594419 [Durotheca rogersii]
MGRRLTRASRRGQESVRVTALQECNAPDIVTAVLDGKAPDASGGRTMIEDEEVYLWGQFEYYGPHNLGAIMGRTPWRKNNNISESIMWIHCGSEKDSVSDTLSTDLSVSPDPGRPKRVCVVFPEPSVPNTSASPTPYSGSTASEAWPGLWQPFKPYPQPIREYLVMLKPTQLDEPSPFTLLKGIPTTPPVTTVISHFTPASFAAACFGIVEERTAGNYWLLLCLKDEGEGLLLLGRNEAEGKFRGTITAVKEQFEQLIYALAGHWR